MDKEQLIKATNILQKHHPNRFPLDNNFISAMQEYAEWYKNQSSDAVQFTKWLIEQEEIVNKYDTLEELYEIFKNQNK